MEEIVKKEERRAQNLTKTNAFLVRAIYFASIFFVCVGVMSAMRRQQHETWKIMLFLSPTALSLLLFLCLSPPVYSYQHRKYPDPAATWNIVNTGKASNNTNQEWKMRENFLSHFSSPARAHCAFYIHFFVYAGMTRCFVHIVTGWERREA